MTHKIYFDGGCSPNPGKMSACVVVIPPLGSSSIHHIKDLGTGTNNLAEWSSLILALTVAKDMGIERPIFYGDSRMVVEQANQRMAVKNEAIKLLYAEYLTVRDNFDCDIVHVRRDFNLAGRYLESGKLE